jgi:predicted transcriptional regulator
MGKPLPQIDEATDISEPYRLVLAGHGGVIVTKNSVPQGFLALIDLVNYWAARYVKEAGA